MASFDDVRPLASIGYDDDGVPVGVTLPDGSESQFADAVEDLLLCAGMDFGRASELALKVDRLASQFFADGRGRSDAEILAQLAVRLENSNIGKTTTGRAFVRCLQGQKSPTLEADATRLGITRQALHKAQRRLARVLFG